MAIHSDIIQSLKSLPCFTEIQEVSLLAEGFSHTCVKVITTTQVFFAKKLNNTTANGEVNASIACADLNISPHIVYYDKLWLVTKFVESCSLADAKMSVDSKTIIALTLLASCNSLVASEHYQAIPLLDTRQSANALLLSPAPCLVPHLEILNKVTHSLTDAIDSLLYKTQPLNVLCHGDVNFTNVLMGKDQKPWLIDFECAHRAPVEFDLAMFVAVNDIVIDEHKLQEVIDVYTTLVPNVSINLALLDHYQLYSCYINGLWYLDNNLESLAITQWSAFDKLASKQAINLAKLLPLITEYT
jgi:hypothetical protein